LEPEEFRRLTGVKPGTFLEMLAALKEAEIEKPFLGLTQEKIPLQKLHSPQIIYLPNYVTEARSYYDSFTSS